MTRATDRREMVPVLAGTTNGPEADHASPLCLSPEKSRDPHSRENRARKADAVRGPVVARVTAAQVPDCGYEGLSTSAGQLEHGRDRWGSRHKPLQGQRRRAGSIGRRTCRLDGRDGRSHRCDRPPLAGNGPPRLVVQPSHRRAARPVQAGHRPSPRLGERARTDRGHRRAVRDRTTKDRRRAAPGRDPAAYPRRGGAAPGRIRQSRRGRLRLHGSSRRRASGVVDMAAFAERGAERDRLETSALS